MTEEAILIIDDDPSVLKIASQILEIKGYKVNTAESAEEGLDILCKNNTMIAICDQSLPGMSGVDFFEKTKTSYPYLYRVLFTGQNNLNPTDAINRAEVHYFFNKPFMPEELLWAVSRILEQRRHRLQYEAILSDLDRLATEKANAALTFERRYRAAIDQMMSFIILARWDDGAVIEMNPHAHDLLGIKPGAENCPPLSKIFSSPRFFQDLRHALKQHGKISGAENAIYLSGGEEIPVSVAAYILDDSTTGEKNILAVLNDLSTETDLQYQLTQTHAYFRATLDAISDPIFSVDNRKSIVFVNEAMAFLYESSPAWVKAFSCCDVMPDCKQRNQCKKTRQDIHCPVEMVIKTGDTYSDQMHCRLGKSKKKWWNRTVFPVQRRDGRIRQVVMVMRDVTSEVIAKKQVDALNQELKKMVTQTRTKNEKLSKALADLREAQSFLLQSEKMASIGQLAAGVAHEINNPVGFINSNLNSLADYIRDLKNLLRLYEEALEAGEKNTDSTMPCEARGKISRFKQEIDLNFVLEDIDELISQSLDGTERVKKIVADLKDFSHADRPELEYADINRGIESTLNIVWNELKYKATVIKNYGELQPLLCYARQLNQVFMNLLVNAAQAIKSTGEITITTRAVHKPAPGIEVEISDTGSGIPPEIHKHVFEPFFTTKPVGKGTGLGLNVCYKIVQAHKGDIKFESNVGKGTTFTIYLPLLEEKDFEKQNPGQ